MCAQCTRSPTHPHHTQAKSRKQNNSSIMPSVLNYSIKILIIGYLGGGACCV